MIWSVSKALGGFLTLREACVTCRGACLAHRETPDTQGGMPNKLISGYGLGHTTLTHSSTCALGVHLQILHKRKGFVRIALQTGAHLVPVIGFGETDLFDISQPKPGSWTHRVQR